jgi:trk system potassium uptake protein TrkH
MRYAAYLKSRYAAILGYTGYIWAIAGLFILAPLLGLFFFPGEVELVPAFLFPGLSMLFLGTLLWRRLRPAPDFTLSTLEGAVIVNLVWASSMLVGALPFIIAMKLPFTLAMFESTSGWSTTGLSIVDVEAAPRLILLYRSIVQWAGGAGFAIIMLTLLSSPTGTGLSAAEGRGDQLEPHVRRSAGLVMRLYTGFTLIGILALKLAGMSLFDALNHALAALSTGGFSTWAASIGHWDSPLIEAVMIGLMLIGTTNFFTLYLLLQRQPREAGRSTELRFRALVLAILIPLMFFGVAVGLYPTLGQALRVAVFEVISAMSTAGFSSVIYTSWPPLGWILLITLMLMGGGGGSTAGGIKQFRILILFKGLIWDFRRYFLPPGAVNQPSIWKTGEKAFLSDSQIRQAAVFVFMHMSVFILGTLILTAHGYPLAESLFEFASSVSTVGLSVGIVSPDAPATALWTLMGGMFLGRLEFIPVIVGVMKIIDDVRGVRG